MATLPEAFQAALLHHQAGRLREAEALYREFLRQQPEHAAAHNNLGAMLLAEGKGGEAIGHFRQAARIDGQSADAHRNLATALAEQSRFDEAAEAYRQAARLAPQNSLVRIHLAAVYQALNRHDEAIACCREALRLDPGSALAHTTLGAALAKQQRIDEAIECHREALSLDPELAQAHFNLGLALFARDEPAGALESFHQALARQPNLAVAHYNLAAVQKAIGDLAAADRSLCEALRIDPHYAEAHYNHATLLLGRGDYSAWSEFEWRWKLPGTGKKPSTPAWNGEPLAGRTIMLYAEQGLGDVLQFIRYAPQVKARGGTVLVCCQQQLKAFLSTCQGIDRFCHFDEPMPPYDVQAALLSLPRILQTDAHSIPARVPYLSARPDLVEQWRAKLPSDGRLRVGINWQGNPSFRHDRARSIPLAEFAPLARVDGVRLFSLQKGFGVEQLADAPFEVEDLGSQVDNGQTNLCEAAAVIKNLDLVITSDTAVAHLAGALGAPVWVALSHVPDWRWGFDNREDCPWYPTMRLFRRQAAGRWHELFLRVAGRLQQLARAASRPDRPA